MAFSVVKVVAMVSQFVWLRYYRWLAGVGGRVSGYGYLPVDEKERAVILRLGKFHSIQEPGLHWNPTNW